YRFDLYLIDNSPFSQTSDEIVAGGTTSLDLSVLAERTFVYKFPNYISALSRLAPGALQKLIAIEASRKLQQRIAGDINKLGYDACFIHACRYSLSVPIAQWLKIPSVYFAQETKRIYYESRLISKLRLENDRWASMRSILEKPYRMLDRRRDRVAVKSADLILCNSEYSRRELSSAYQVNPTLCYLGISPETFSDVLVNDSNLKNQRNGIISVISVGALDPIKGHDLAVSALGEASRETKVDTELTIVFERETSGYRGYLTDLAARSGVKLDFQKGISDQELARRYSLADLVICAAHSEPFGLTVNEAFSCGTPVVAVDEGGYLETVKDGYNGFLVKRDPMEMAKAIVKVKNGELGISPQELREETLKHWSWDQTASNVAKSFESIIKKF
ncbi:MAG: glycosyltransferase family 4 protein, partial [Acidimicrobiales bacterium]|nr:glycosyltransferase family 4 protein [Acidimicrobiales bacterium]